MGGQTVTTNDQKKKGRRIGPDKALHREAAARQFPDPGTRAAIKFAERQETLCASSLGNLLNRFFFFRYGARPWTYMKRALTGPPTARQHEPEFTGENWCAYEHPPTKSAVGVTREERVGQSNPRRPVVICCNTHVFRGTLHCPIVQFNRRELNPRARRRPASTQINGEIGVNGIRPLSPSTLSIGATSTELLRETVGQPLAMYSIAMNGNSCNEEQAC